MKIDNDHNERVAETVSRVKKKRKWLYSKQKITKVEKTANSGEMREVFEKTSDKREIKKKLEINPPPQ